MNSADFGIHLTIMGKLWHVHRIRHAISDVDGTTMRLQIDSDVRDPTELWQFPLVPGTRVYQVDQVEKNEVPKEIPTMMMITKRRRRQMLRMPRAETDLPNVMRLSLTVNDCPFVCFW